MPPQAPNCRGLHASFPLFPFLFHPVRNRSSVRPCPCSLPACSPVHARRILRPWPGYLFSDCLLTVYRCTRIPVDIRRILLPGLATRSLTVCS